MYFAYTSIVAFSVGRLCHVLEVYICCRMRGVAGIRVARGLDKVFHRLAKTGLSAMISSEKDQSVIQPAIKQRAPLLTLNGGLRERARELKLNVLEANTR